MRLAAQIAFVVVVVLVGANWKYGVLLPLFWPLLFVAVSPVLWYVIFDRGRRPHADELLLKLDAIVNAIRETP
jgi:hypothetical protein